jgi:hypothetical protein
MAKEKGTARATARKKRRASVAVQFARRQEQEAGTVQCI